MTRNRKKILFVFGTRPEAIKLAPVIDEFRKQKSSFITRVCVTAQHRDMLDQVLRLFKIPVHHDLNIMKRSQRLGDVTARAIVGVQSVLERENPDIVMVQGDTTTTFAASLTAFYHQIPVAHLEAGLRTGNVNNPFPEETNRVLASRLVNLHLAPTRSARKNLLNEGVSSHKVVVTGNTVVDALLSIRRVQAKKKRSHSLLRGIDFSRKLILVTGHRRESFGPEFRNICRAIHKLATTFPDVEIVYPVHLNPNVRHPVQEILAGHKNIYLLPPLDYGVFVSLMSDCYLILTDSGGIQEEAPSLGKPVLVMRRQTERPEGVKAGTVRLVGTRTDVIVREASRLLNKPREYRKMQRAHNPYGDGKARKRVVRAVRKYFRNVAGAGRRKS